MACSSNGYAGGDRLIAGIVLAVVTFWLFAQTTFNVLPWNHPTCRAVSLLFSFWAPLRHCATTRDGSPLLAPALSAQRHLIARIRGAIEWPHAVLPWVLCPSAQSLRLKRRPLFTCGPSYTHFTKETVMQWTTPTYTDLRFGFEITMYIATR
ncbi:coenzyme PQQ precursor peptide PqqA [Paraburkholderia sp. BL10I2N1]|nr:coenzyme PQQ precursor peptide PqqA [Paraburkholderia sp. BL10I2N1]